MKKYLFLALSLTSVYTLSAQDDEAAAFKEPSKESSAYHVYRQKLNSPPYGLEKIKALIKKIDVVADDEPQALPQKTYLALSLQEKFTYHMLHGETFSQNCDATPPVQDEQKKIFAQLPDAFGESYWSERQTKFLAANRDSVIAWIQKGVAVSKRVGVNYKLALVEINARELIPWLIETYNQTKKDHDILTVLMLLMKNNEYLPFMESLSYKKLYADKYASYNAYLNFNTSNEELIIQRATDFYHGLAK